MFASRVRMGDSDYYSDRGTALAEYVRGSREPVVIFRLNQYGWNGYVDLIGFFYSIFGFSPSAVKGINCLLGAGLGPLVFFLAIGIFNREVARWAAWGTAFFPSLICWSASNLKDIPLIFLTSLAILLFIRWTKVRGIPRRVLYGLALGLTLLLHASIREMMWAPLIAGLIAAAALNRFRIRAWTAALGIGLGIGSLYWDPAARSFRSLLAQCFYKHIGYTLTPGIGYFLFPNTSAFYTYGYLWQWAESGRVDLTIWRALLRAPMHFFLEPLPWRFDALFHLPVLLQMILWYGVLLLAARGIFASLRQRAQGALFLLLPFLALSFLIALTIGNVGTLFRVRDMVTPFLLIYASVGLGEILRPEVIHGSRLAAWVSSIQPRFLAPVRAWMRKPLEWKRRFIAGFLASPVRGTGDVLIIAVLVNSSLLFFRGAEWTTWSVGFRIGTLLAGLWALAVRSNWARVQKSSRLMALFRKTDFQAKISDTILP